MGSEGKGTGCAGEEDGAAEQGGLCGEKAMRIQKRTAEASGPVLEVGAITGPFLTLFLPLGVSVVGAEESGSCPATPSVGRGEPFSGGAVGRATHSTPTPSQPHFSISI